MRQKCLPIIVLSPLNSPLLLRHNQNSGALYDDYAKGDFDGLRSSFQAANLSNAISSGDLDIDRDWHSWKDTFLECGRLYPEEKTQGKESSNLDKRVYINPDKEKGTHA